jgi:hypothetical protein
MQGKTIERIKKHKAVEDLYRDCDGYWVVLKDGYNYFNACTFREDTLTGLLRNLKLIEEGSPITHN